MTVRGVLARVIPRQINPIVVKELRQAVRSRFVAALLLLFLAVELFGIGIILLTTSAREIASLANYTIGRETFQFLYAALSVACMLFIPMYAGIRLASERWDNNLDLLFVTTIKPAEIVRGKLAAAMCIAALLFSAAAPFMAFSYLLRGIDLPSVFIALGLVFLVVIAATQATLFIACIPASRVFKAILGLGSLGALFGAIGIVNSAGWYMATSGIGSSMQTWEFWAVTVSTIGGVWLLSHMLQHLAVALISPPSANRALAVRRFATLLWGIAGGWIFTVAAIESSEDMLLIWTLPSMVVLAATVLIGLSEDTQISARVRRTIPRNIFVRALAFLFYNGPFAALCWCGILAIATLGLTSVGSQIIRPGHAGYVTHEESLIATTFLLYVIAYGLTAVFLRRTLFRRRLKPSVVWVMSLLMIAVGALLPSIVALLMGDYSWSDPAAWHMGNIVTIGSRERQEPHAVFAFSWVALALLVNAPWIVAQLRNFTPRAPAKA